MDVEIRHLRAFVAVARHRSYTRAASELLVTQPSLSRTVQQLEATLRVKLVERSSRHVGLTAVGKEFLHHAQRVLSELDQAVAAAGAHRTLRLGFSWLLPDPWAQQTIDRFENATGAKVVLVRCDDPLTALRQATIDLAFIRRCTPLADAHTVHLLDEGRIAVVSTRSQLAGREQIGWDEIRDWPMVVNTVTGTTNPQSWPPEHRPDSIVPAVSFEEWFEYIAADRGIGVASQLVARRSNHPAVLFIPIPDAPPVRSRLIYLPPAPQSLVRQFIDAATTIAAAVAPSGTT